MATWRVENLEQLDPDTLDALNRRLLAGKTDLDWSALRTIPSRKQLGRLLKGLNLFSHSDYLGIETVPDFLYEPLLAILSAGQGQSPPRETKPVETRKYQQTPRVWFPKGQDFDADATVQKRLSAPQNIADLVSQKEELSAPVRPALNRPEAKKTSESDFFRANVPGGNYAQRMRAARARIVLDMKELSTSNATKLYDRLQPLITAYKIWVGEQEPRLRSSSGQRGSQDGTGRLQAYQKLATRLEESVNILKRRPDAAQAFAFMNRAMWLQRIHTLYAQERQHNGKVELQSVDLPENYRWALFQLAFLLLNIPALTNLYHLDRGEEGSAIADLLWSLPGADKIDVYLGLIAYDLAIRRLQGYVGGRSSENGVAVLLRYTHLSKEQLQRVYTLLCACETIRRGESSWGASPFRLGVWMGARSATVSADDDTSETWKKQDVRRLTENLLDISNCPWCGEAVVGKSAGDGKGVVSYCGDPIERCLFSKKKVRGGGLPALLFNEKIYQMTPSVLIATVDTFVNGPWKEETRALFGQVEKRNASQPSSQYSAQTARGTWLRPPDLVLQDDLEQISGHTGSQAGQAVIDHLSSWKIDEIKVRPKVIAALPTFRQPDQEMRAMLCMREISVFPPPGRYPEESFFFS